MDTGTFPTDLSSLTIEYTGKEVICNVMQMKENGGIYLSECKVGRTEVKDSHTDDGWYHYGTRDLTNEEYVDMYGLALKNASVAYYEANGTIVEDYTSLTIDYNGKPVACEVTVNYNGTIYMTKCKVNNVDVTSDTEDGYYYYGSIVNPPTAVNDLLEKVNPVTVTSYTDGNTGEMYTFEHPATEQTSALTDYRYIGSNPNNYVYFNGNELWRIIGIFTVEDENGNVEQRIKIVKNEKLSSSMYWNSNYLSEWSTASLNTYLNGDYYNELSDTSQSMIAISKYYLGGNGGNSNNFGTTEDMYAWERGTEVYNGRSISWNGKIALIYPSDNFYTYALGVSNVCYYREYNCVNQNVSWIYNNDSALGYWLLSPYSGVGRYLFYIDRSGLLFRMEARGEPKGIRPTLYLSSQVKIVSGDGSEQNPYQLSM